MKNFQWFSWLRLLTNCVVATLNAIVAAIVVRNSMRDHTDSEGKHHDGSTANQARIIGMIVGMAWLLALAAVTYLVTLCRGGLPCLAYGFDQMCWPGFGKPVSSEDKPYRLANKWGHITAWCLSAIVAANLAASRTDLVSDEKQPPSLQWSAVAYGIGFAVIASLLVIWARFKCLDKPATIDPESPLISSSARI